MFKSYKFKLLPNKQQTELLNQWESNSRWLWNYFVDLEKKEYASTGKFIWKYDLINLLPDLKKINPWLKNSYAKSLQQIAFSTEKALKDIKRGKKFPKFKLKGKRNGQILIPFQLANGKDPTIRLLDNYIQLPKIGKVRWTKYRELPTNGKIKSASIIKDIDDWYVSVLIELPEIDKLPIDITTSKSIGIDLGIKHFIVDSNGNQVDSPKFMQKKISRLRRYQRQYSKKQMSSKNQEKARKKLAHIHRDIRNQRKDFLHKISTEIVMSNDIICVEDLKTKDLLSRNKSKSLNRQIADQGWSTFLSFLKYKCNWHGKTFTQIGQYEPSSKTCNKCHYKKTDLKLSDRQWICPVCGELHDRDINAAINILNWGLLSTKILETNTAGTAGINACEVSNNFNCIEVVDGVCDIDIREDTSKQEATNI